MYDCGNCEDTFHCKDDFIDHLVEEDHDWPECETCTRRFNTQSACRQHMNATDHWSERYPCETCDLEFLSVGAVNQHMAAKGHWKNYCRDCDRHFDNKNNFRMHMNSRTHRGTTVNCPFCKTQYATAGGLSHHLERGACPKAPRLNRDTILQINRERDPNHLITKKRIT